jgi:hypothetical protein
MIEVDGVEMDQIKIKISDKWPEFMNYKKI